MTTFEAILLFWDLFTERGRATLSVVGMMQPFMCRKRWIVPVGSRWAPCNFLNGLNLREKKDVGVGLSYIWPRACVAVSVVEIGRADYSSATPRRAHRSSASMTGSCRSLAARLEWYSLRVSSAYPSIYRKPKTSWSE